MPNKFEKLADGHYLAEGELGEHFTGSADEIIPTILDAQQNTKKAYQQEKAARATAEQRAAQLEQELAASKQPPPPPANDAASQTRKWLWSELAADINPNLNGEQLKATLLSNQAAMEKWNFDRTLANFKSKCNDFPDTAEASDAVVARAQRDFGIADFDQFSKSNPDVAAKCLIAAHQFCVDDGIYKPLDAAQQRYADGDAAALNEQRNPTAPPMLRTSNPEMASPQGSDPYAMDMEALRKAAIAQELARK